MLTYGVAPNKEYESTTSRYRNLRVLTDTDTDQKYLETYNQKIVPEVENNLFGPSQTYHVVSQSESGRLDMVSLKCYGTPVYWWFIALANECIDPFIIKEGDILKIPDLTLMSDYRYEIITYLEGPSYA